MAYPYTLKDIGNLIVSSGKQFMENNSPRLAAALAYNTIFSLPPLLLIVVKAAGALFGEEAISGQLYKETKGVIGPEAAEGIQTLLQNETMETNGSMAALISIGMLVFAATTFFVTLQESLNTVWNLKVKPENSFLKLAKDRMLSFGLILGIALLLLISFVLTAVISFLSDYLREILPGIGYYAVRALEFVVSFSIITLLFALIYKFLPDAIIRWRDTLYGAAITALLFVVGKFLIGWYLGSSDIGSTYGAAGSIILILVWVYYSSFIIFYGAEFAQQFANHYGSKVVPKPHAVRIKVIEEPFEETEEYKIAGRPKPEGRFRK